MGLSVKKLFAQDCEFVAGAADASRIPPPSMPEVAFVGRSNVGKSSLFNALVRRKSLARMSKTPGCTQQLNFYRLGEALWMVDVPGYGYAKASRKEVSGWTELTLNYLRGRPNLRQIFLLIDSRHGVKLSDREMMKLLDESAVSYQIVLTKIDKQTKAGLEALKKAINVLGAQHPALHPEVLMTSAAAGEGLDAMRGAIAFFCQ